jgi:hypothetical protein
MKLTKGRLGALLLACLTIAAISAPAAQANWEIGGKAFVNEQEQEVSIGETEPLTITSKALGSEVVVAASVYHCRALFCKYRQDGSIEYVILGKAEVTQTKVTKPAGCTGATISLNSLTGELIMDPSGGSATFIKIGPTTGEVLGELTLSGTCAAAGTAFPLKGTLTARFANTGVSAVSQKLTFSAAEQTTGGGSLKLGKESATITGSFGLSNSGTNVGASWSGS